MAARIQERAAEKSKDISKVIKNIKETTLTKQSPWSDMVKAVVPLVYP